jgi:hypothetical protein
MLNAKARIMKQELRDRRQAEIAGGNVRKPIVVSSQCLFGRICVHQVAQNQGESRPFETFFLFVASKMAPFFENISDYFFGKPRMVGSPFYQKPARTRRSLALPVIFYANTIK